MEILDGKKVSNEIKAQIKEKIENEYVNKKTIPFNSWVGKIPWRRKWQPTPVFSPGESHGQSSLAGCSPWGSKSQTRLSDYIIIIDCLG